MKKSITLVLFCALSTPMLAFTVQAANTKVVDDGMPSTLRPSGYQPKYPSDAKTIARGEALFRSDKLSTNGRACASCHSTAASFGPGFAKPYPHPAMNAQSRFGVEKLHLDEVIQVCLQGPLKSTPLEWGSSEQADLVAYLSFVQKTGKINAR